MMLLSLGPWLSGCAPTAEGLSDEQRNAHYIAGKEKLSAFDYKGAVESFERALEDNPRSALTHFELGVLYEQQEHDYAAALHHYNRALKFRPNGYPADNIRQRVPACRQELVKADSLATINPTLLGEIQVLRATNQWLLRELDVARLQLAGRGGDRSAAGHPPAQGQVQRNAAGGGELSFPGSTPGGGRADPGAGVRPGTAPTGGATRASGGPSRAGRTHSVKSGDTPASIARQHGVRLPALLAANPGLDPKRLRVGQIVNVPAS